MSTTKALVNVVAGEKAKQEYAITGASHRAYAEACGAVYSLITRDVVPDFPPAIKYLVNNAAMYYDQTLYLDVDTVITKLAPNIFEEVPLGHWGIVDELGLLSDAKPGYTEEQQDYADKICDNLNWPRICLRFALNSGVMLMPKQTDKLYWPPPRPVPNFWNLDQLFLSIRLQMIAQPMLCLDPRWNWCHSYRLFEQGVPNAFIIHLADATDRVDQLQRLTRTYGL